MFLMKVWKYFNISHEKIALKQCEWQEVCGKPSYGTDLMYRGFSLAAEPNKHIKYYGCFCVKYDLILIVNVNATSFYAIVSNIG